MSIWALKSHSVYCVCMSGSMSESMAAVHLTATSVAINKGF